ncbi:hypothetical protein [Miniphocaeibacter massiliensis]|uniref:hypothetical protein n=1 Tax=Miniphocaeibacter massiliensis TaxID=2041841 RepID=UPI000C0766BA|nr:hypothetical protein [Miniphocaeibacter massiliensis]
MDDAFSNPDTVLIQDNNGNDVKDKYLKQLLEYYREKDYEAIGDLMDKKDFSIGTDRNIIR